MAITRKQFAQEMTEAVNKFIFPCFEEMQEQPTVDLIVERDELNLNLEQLLVDGNISPMDELYLSMITEVLKNRGVS